MVFQELGVISPSFLSHFEPFLLNCPISSPRYVRQESVPSSARLFRVMRLLLGENFLRPIQWVFLGSKWLELFPQKIWH